MVSTRDRQVSWLEAKLLPRIVSDPPVDAVILAAVRHMALLNKDVGHTPNRLCLTALYVVGQLGCAE